jgi:hypothetical protein
VPPELAAQLSRCQFTLKETYEQALRFMMDYEISFPGKSYKSKAKGGFPPLYWRMVVSIPVGFSGSLQPYIGSGIAT